MRPIYTELEQNLVLCGVAATWRKLIHAAAAVSVSLRSTRSDIKPRSVINGADQFRTTVRFNFVQRYKYNGVQRNLKQNRNARSNPFKMPQKWL